MIVFTFDSLDLICSMLSTVKDITKTAIFYNNGTILLKVVDFKILNDNLGRRLLNIDYEHKYVFTLFDGSSLRVSLIGDTMVIDT